MQRKKTLLLWILIIFINLLYLSPLSMAAEDISPVYLLLFDDENEFCKLNTDCESSEYCAKSVNDCDGSGECTEKPSACPDVWDPVCGCDNETYGNSCEANAAGVNVEHDGECIIVPVTCMENTECKSTEYCAKSVNDCDGSGECTEKPSACPDVWDPVCRVKFEEYFCMVHPFIKKVFPVY